MKKYLSMLGLVAFGMTAIAQATPGDQWAASANESCADTSSLSSSEMAAVGDTYWHRCTAKDACGHYFTATGICRDHAENAAIRKCEDGTKDAGSCRIVDCCPTK